MSCCLTAFLGYCTLVNDFAPQAHCNDVLNDFRCKSSNGVKNAFFATWYKLYVEQVLVLVLVLVLALVLVLVQVCLGNRFF